MQYVDFTYYSNTYKGTLSETYFDSLVSKACRSIDANINIELTESLITKLLSDEAQAQLKDVACALIELIYKKEESQSRKITAMSIDGVSKTFSSFSNADYNNQKKEILSGLPRILTCYL